MSDPAGGCWPKAAARALEAELAEAGTPERAEHEQRYLRSDLHHLGVPVPRVRAATTRLARRQGGLRPDDVMALVDALWARRVHELRLAAVELLCWYGDRVGPADLSLVERLAREARTWGLIDPLAIGVAGRVVGADPVTHPVVARTLDDWAGDPDFWIRRTALLALLPGLRAGSGDFERFGRYADALLGEREFFIRKALGWVLRETGRRRPDLVHGWLADRMDRVSGLTLREATKPLPPHQVDDLLARRRSVRPSPKRPRPKAGPLQNCSLTD